MLIGLCAKEFGARTKKRRKKEVVPGFEPGLFGSKPKVITTTLYNHLRTFYFMSKYGERNSCGGTAFSSS